MIFLVKCEHAACTTIYGYAKKLRSFLCCWSSNSPEFLPSPDAVVPEHSSGPPSTPPVAEAKIETQENSFTLIVYVQCLGIDLMDGPSKIKFTQGDLPKKSIF